MTAIRLPSEPTSLGSLNGVTYFFRVAAINSQGTGAAALTSLGIVPSDVPAPPTVDGLTAIAAGIVVDFTPGSSDSEITGYDYRLDAGDWTAGSVIGESTHDLWPHQWPHVLRGDPGPQHRRSQRVVDACANQQPRVTSPCHRLPCWLQRVTDRWLSTG